MAELTLKKLAMKVLMETHTPMTASEIWKYATQSDNYNLDKFQGKTPWTTMSAYIYADIKENENQSTFIKLSSRPVKFYLRALKVPEVVNNDISSLLSPAKNAVKERELHKYLTYFADRQLNTYTKTINDKKSSKSKKGSNEWVHPDMVGIYTPREDWDVVVLDLNGLTGSTTIKLMSFELKVNLDFTNLREAFFQTVSNSYWANESYLVASNINKDFDFIDELKRLSSAYGVGVIELDLDDPDNSSILFSAATRSELDWESINKLCSINSDFKTFIKTVLLILKDKDKTLGRRNLLPYFDDIPSFSHE